MARPERAASAVDSSTARIVGPVRTCVGCRGRDAKPALLRVVVVAGALTADPAGRLPGRGACVHLDLACVDLADRRRAFSRALRVPGPLDAGSVREHVAQAAALASTAVRTESVRPHREQVEKP